MSGCFPFFRYVILSLHVIGWNLTKSFPTKIYTHFLFLHMWPNDSGNHSNFYVIKIQHLDSIN
jgi:hypothetical protein